jgi:hypothetical protein
LCIVLVGVRLHLDAFRGIGVVERTPFIVVGSAEPDLSLGAAPSWIAACQIRYAAAKVSVDNQVSGVIG